MTFQTNFIVIKRGCPVCRETVKAINFFNLRLPIQKRIQIYDNYLWDEFIVQIHPICSKVARDGFDSYPFIYLEGCKVEPCERILLKPFLEGFFKKDMLI